MSSQATIVKRVGQEHRQNLAKLIKQASYMHATWQIWDDLIYFCSVSLSQPLQWVQAREDEYLARIKRYDKETQALFPEMFAEIVLAFGQEGCTDVLGDMYMQLELFNKWKGQFFTPSHVCDLMARINADNLPEQLKQKDYITVNDPCCGGGAMLIAFAKAALEMDVNYQNHILFVGQDIDPVVARMCYISMSLLGMPGYVIIGNSLLMECREIMYTPLYFANGFQWRQQLSKISESFAALVDDAPVVHQTSSVEISADQVSLIF